MLAAGFSNDSVIAGSFTLAQLMAFDPAASPRKYAWCTDLFGGPGDWCISDGQSWKPVRPFGVRSSAMAADASLTPMADAPTQIITGALSVTRALTLSTQYAYRGAIFRTCRKATGLGLLLVNGLGLSLNSWADYEFDGSAWVQTASGGLL